MLAIGEEKPIAWAYACVPGRSGDRIPVEFVGRDEEGFYHRGANCPNSMWWDLGTCRCVSHKSSFFLRITAEEAQKLLQKGTSS